MGWWERNAVWLIGAVAAVVATGAVLGVFGDDVGRALWRAVVLGALLYIAYRMIEKSHR